MRTIKFRGKDIATKEWVYGFYTQGGYVNMDDTITVRHIIDSETLHDVIPETVSQFTGLYDKNGNEIYEWDIVDVTSVRPQDIGQKIICSIAYDEIHACYIFIAKDRKRVICNTISDCELKKIGNIHDNPELL